MTILKVVNMTTVTYGGVPAIRAVHMRCRHDLPRCLASLRWTLESSPIGGNQVYSLVLTILSFETPPTIEFAATGVRYEVSGSLDGLTTEKGIVERS